MLKLLQRFRSRHRRQDAQLELVSLHIPKTAGTSFRHILKRIYAEGEVVRLDIPLGKRRVRVNEQRYREDKLPAGTRVIHGHFSLPELYKHFPHAEGLPVITWVRDPVERVISNYFYLEKILEQIVDEEGRGVNLLSKMQRSLLEYARAEVNRNRQSKFLVGKDLEDFAFVAIQEHYAEELVALSQYMNWPPPEEIKVNVTGKSRPEVSPEDRAEIARLNADDVALYQRALHLRQRRNENKRVSLISIHIPKTGGTSFYKSLRAVYGDQVSPSYRRRDIHKITAEHGDLAGAIPAGVNVLHGHFRYGEIRRIYESNHPKIVTWLREPVARVISNYRFFKAGLNDPARNPEQYRANKHRVGESLLTYAELPENRNVMARFLDGIDLEELSFIGLLEHYAEDLDRLQRLLGTPALDLVNANESSSASWEKEFDDPAVRAQIATWNDLDVALYHKALKLRPSE